MTQSEAFLELWITHDWWMMGYDRKTLYESMTKQEVLRRLKQEREAIRGVRG